MKLIILFVSLLTVSTSIFAQQTSPDKKNPVSVHVLNLQTGVPSPGIKVVLEKKQDDSWVVLANSETNNDGRINQLYPEGQAMTEGIYKVTFKTGDYFDNNKMATFFPEIPVIFQVSKTDEHYHIPLLLSQYGYSTYRGS